jgi:hypothetical protein
VVPVPVDAERFFVINIILCFISCGIHMNYKYQVLLILLSIGDWGGTKLKKLTVHTI